MSSSTDRTPAQPAAAAPADAPFDYVEAERLRADARRAALQIARPPGHEAAPWALALSGGGIRSATFCLGVLQGLARARAPAQCADAAAMPDVPRNGLLRQFDYLSTVSGGGFIGCFFGSLFRKKRLNVQQDLDEKATAEQAYAVLREDPPGRLHGTDYFDPAHPGRMPLAWLRENGRYMAASGSERAYAAAISIRNWCAMHYVLGTILVCLYLFLAFAHVSVMYWEEVFVGTNYIRNYEIALLGSVEDRITAIWWSPAWWLLIPLVLFWLLPAGVAYWMTHPPLDKDLTSPPQRFSRASLFALFAGAALMAFAWYGQRALGSEWNPVADALAAVGFITLMGVVWHTLTYFYPSITAQRVGLTRALLNAMLCIAAIAFFATIHTAAQTLYLRYGTLFSWLGATTKALVESNVHDESPFGVAAGGMVALLVWLVRWLTAAFDEKEREGWLARIPMETLVTAGAALLFFLVALFWAQLVLWIQWRGVESSFFMLLDSEYRLESLQVLGVVLLLALGLTVIIGRFPGFLNLSTFQGFYSARITRAYMGASNGVRFGEAPGLRRLLSVTQPAPGDLMTLEQYYENPLAPMHLINVCLNQNIDPAEQLVNGDRKGKPLVILPTGFALDGKYAEMPEKKDARGLGARLTVGEWIGVSGAAISTGMGRGGGLGRAMLNGLANLRLGRWWESGVFTGFRSQGARVARQTFKTQAYLIDELFARFYGTRRPLQYLSDGGHFENMALYELLRPQRGVKLIVACDCGCDPQYQFADLANLIRMVRIDFGTEVEVDQKIAKDNILGRVFGTPDAFRSSADHAANKCALLLNVYHNDESYSAQRPDARVVVIKPRMFPEAGPDLEQYQATHSEFPQEPTADQFYDEAQWESYRKLGLEAAKFVFGAGMGDNDAYCERLWQTLLKA
jgi:hypothetical protein